MLELEGLRRRYGEVVALDGLTFTVPPGQVFGFLGPNGAGKTTTMRAVFGLVALDAGEARWRGAAIGERERRGFGYLPEERGLYAGMQVLEQLVFIGRLHGLQAVQAREAALQWTERLGLADRRTDKLESLSLGNQQRIQLAAALVHAPELLVLDEPFSGLDPVAVETMSAVLVERAGAGATVVFSSHQLDLVEHLCEAVAIVNHGRLVAEGAVDALARSGPPRLDVRVAGDRSGTWAAGGLPGIENVDVAPDGTATLTLALGADPQAVLDAARRAGAVEHFSSTRRRLSEVFGEAVGVAQGSEEGAEGRAPVGARAPAGWQAVSP
ncbi:MAG: ATP-binding cassette domain-containing protein [Actinomycetota bacterium]|nr:ATP-binding cassette domain-containing protein [Actinomycetota bacterium]